MPELTLTEVRRLVSEIHECTGDAEIAHIKEDQLLLTVLHWFAEVAPAELGEMARLAVSTQDIDFPRWYA